MKIRIFILIISCCCSLYSYSQKAALQLKVSKEKKTQILSIEKVKGIVVKSKFFSLTPSYPNAKNPELQLFYDVIVENENTMELTSELQKTGNFEKIEPYEIAYTTSNCINPYPINDLKIVNGTINNYAVELINARCAWNITQGNPSVLIGIADSDFELTHEDLTNQIARIKGNITGGYYHGTCVAGAASAETNNQKGICGVGYNCKIAAYRIIHSVSPEGAASASSAEIKNAVWSAYLDGCPIINVSWTATGLNELAAREITENRTTLVLAAGNSPTSMSHSSIANVPGVILVSSVNQNNEYHTGHARNQYVDLCAPGVGVAVAAPGNGYWNAGGHPMRLLWLPELLL